jgi:hypothetical protein
MSGQPAAATPREHEELSEKGSVPSEARKDMAADVKDTEVLEVANADYALALSTGPQLNPRSPKSIQLFLILLVAFMGSMSNGFDGQVMSAVNGMQ